MRGWLSRAAQANTPAKMLIAYARLKKHIETFNGLPIFPFDENAIAEFERLRQAHIRIGTMDMKIAAIVLANNGVLLSRNLAHFSKVPDLQVEDWSI